MSSSPSGKWKICAFHLVSPSLSTLFQLGDVGCDAEGWAASCSSPSGLAASLDSCGLGRLDLSAALWLPLRPLSSRAARWFFEAGVSESRLVRVGAAQRKICGGILNVQLSAGAPAAAASRLLFLTPVDGRMSEHSDIICMEDFLSGIIPELDPEVKSTLHITYFFSFLFFFTGFHLFHKSLKLESHFK